MGRWRVDTEYSSVSFDDSEEEKAWYFYRIHGIRMVKCSDLFDEGVVVAGAPIVKDLSYDTYNHN
jgi:hypothetical protein